jgi:hypothetical protein
MGLFDFFRPKPVLQKPILAPGLFDVMRPKVEPNTLDHFLKGYTIFPDADSIMSARWVSERQQLEIMDHSAGLHTYDDVDAVMAEQFYSTDNKDQWLADTYQKAPHRPVDLGRPIEPQDIRVTADPAHMKAFVDGYLTLHFTSSFGPVMAKYDPAKMALGCVFKDGFVCTYSPIPKIEVERLAASTSKGRWCHKYLKAGYNPDRSWIHRYPIFRNVWVDQYVPSAGPMVNL